MTTLPLGTPLAERSPDRAVDLGELTRDVETYASALAAMFLAWCPRTGPRDAAVAELESLAERFRVLAWEAPSEESPT